MDRLSSFSWRPKTTVLLLGGFGIVLIALAVSFVVTNFKPKTEVWLNASVYQLQLADTEVERTQGLSGVEDIGVNGGLLMHYGIDSECGIWMKDMLIPLDIVWLDKSKKVIYLKRNVSPEIGTDTIMQPKTACRYVLELPAGSIDTAAIKMGQEAKFTLEGDAS